MYSIHKTFLIFLSYIQYIKAHNVKCNSDYGNLFSEYHCAGLIIENTGDTHCCLWNITNSAHENEIRCSSISDAQYADIDGYTLKKINQYNYTNLNIKCAEEETIYCSNIILDQESDFECKDLKIYDKKDNHCCRWTYEDTDNNGKKMNYCASINEFQYRVIKEYIDYKEDTSYYEKLKIDCQGNFRRINILEYLALAIILIII